MNKPIEQVEEQIRWRIVEALSELPLSYLMYLENLTKQMKGAKK